jgi:hypothetical protein
VLSAANEPYRSVLRPRSVLKGTKTNTEVARCLSAVLRDHAIPLRSYWEGTRLTQKHAMAPQQKQRKMAIVGSRSVGA